MAAIRPLRQRLCQHGGGLADGLLVGRSIRRAVPIDARSVSIVERALKWARRRPAAAALVGVLSALSLALPVAGLEFSAQHAKRREAEQRRLDETRAEIYDLHVRGQTAVQSQDWRQAEVLLDKAFAQVQSDPALASLQREIESVRTPVKKSLAALSTHQRFVRERVVLLRKALVLVPAGQRRTYWKDQVMKDVALFPLYHLPAFARLAVVADEGLSRSGIFFDWLQSLRAYAGLGSRPGRWRRRFRPRVMRLETRVLPSVALPGPFPVGISPYTVVAAALSARGKIDLVTANKLSNNVSVLVGDGAGTFRTAGSFSTGAGPVAVAVAGLRGDGIADLVTANQYSNDVSVLLGNGDGSFQAPRNFPVGLTPVSVAVGDLGNGHLDIVTANQLSSNAIGALLPAESDGGAHRQDEASTAATPAKFEVLKYLMSPVEDTPLGPASGPKQVAPALAQGGWDTQVVDVVFRDW